MIIDASFVVPTTADAVLDALSDPETAVAALPGAKLRERHDDGSVEADVYLPLGRTRTGYRVAVIATGVDREAGSINLESAGHELRGKGTWLAGTAIRLRESAGSTTVSMQIDLEVTGRAERAGEDAVRAGFIELANAFGTALSAHIVSGEAVNPAPVDHVGDAPTGAIAAPDRGEWPRVAQGGDVEVLTGSGDHDQNADGGTVPPWWRIDIAGEPPAGEPRAPRTPDRAAEEAGVTRQFMSPAWPTAPSPRAGEAAPEQEQPLIAAQSPSTTIAAPASTSPEPEPEPEPESIPAPDRGVHTVPGRVQVMTDGPIPAAGIPIGDSVGARLQALNRDKPWAIPAGLLALLALILMVRRRRR